MQVVIEGDEIAITSPASAGQIERDLDDLHERARRNGKMRFGSHHGAVSATPSQPVEMRVMEAVTS